MVRLIIFLVKLVKRETQTKKDAKKWKNIKATMEHVETGNKMKKARRKLHKQSATKRVEVPQEL